MIQKQADSSQRTSTIPLQSLITKISALDDIYHKDHAGWRVSTAGDRNCNQRLIVTEHGWQKRYRSESPKSVFTTKQRHSSKYFDAWWANTWNRPLKTKAKTLSVGGQVAIADSIRKKKEICWKRNEVIWLMNWLRNKNFHSNLPQKRNRQVGFKPNRCNMITLTYN